MRPIRQDEFDEQQDDINEVLRLLRQRIRNMYTLLVFSVVAVVALFIMLTVAYFGQRTLSHQLHRQTALIEQLQPRSRR